MDLDVKIVSDGIDSAVGVHDVHTMLARYDIFEARQIYGTNQILIKVRLAPTGICF